MKKIEAVIQPEKLNDVREALADADYPGITVTEITGHGKQKAKVQQWRGDSYRVAFLSKVKIEIVCADKEAEGIIQIISAAAFTGGFGDGKIFLSDIREAIRIRTGERGSKALS
ncbi:MAG: P-II family nitrogen regulator [Candidatus Omnitrophota bacterium]|nr:P-II family nitrogen regulator [Candidatus Omnitrophota bacterium]